MTDVKLMGIPPDQWAHAAHVAKRFDGLYGDSKMGIRNGTAFVDLMGKEPGFYVYRTKTQVVVRISTGGDA